MTLSTAPWTNEQVENLNRYQNSGVFHPFTCVHCRDNPDNHVFNPNFGCKILDASKDYNLIATNNGWICSSCDYTQDWAHDFMVGFTQEVLNTHFPWVTKYLKKD